MQHPWITRKFDSPIPISHHEEIDNQIAKREFTNIVKLLIFLSQFPSIKLHLDIKTSSIDSSIPEIFINKTTTSNIKIKPLAFKFPPKLSNVGPMRSFRNPKNETTLRPPLQLEDNKSDRSSSPTKIEGGTYDLIPSSSRASSKKRKSRNFASSAGSSLGNLKTPRSNLPPSTARKLSENDDLKLPSLTRAEKMALKIQKSVMQKMGSVKNKSKFQPVMLGDMKPEMMKTVHGSFVHRSAEKERQVRKMMLQPITVDSYRSFKPEQKMTIVNTPTRTIIK